MDRWLRDLGLGYEEESGEVTYPLSGGSFKDDGSVRVSLISFGPLTLESHGPRMSKLIGQELDNG